MDSAGESDTVEPIRARTDGTQIWTEDGRRFHRLARDLASTDPDRPYSARDGGRGNGYGIRSGIRLGDGSRQTSKSAAQRSDLGSDPGLQLTMSRHENDPPRRIFAVLLGLGVIANPVQARAPSDGELQTAYCIPIVKGELEVAQRAVAAQEKSLAEINAAAGSSDMVKAAIEVLDNLRGEAARYRALLSRMQTYLLPGAGEMDPAALSTAENRGRADWQSLMAGRDGVDKDVARRTKSCNDPTWLPS